MQMFVNIWAHR